MPFDVCLGVFALVTLVTNLLHRRAVGRSAVAGSHRPAMSALHPAEPGNEGLLANAQLAAVLASGLLSVAGVLPPVWTLGTLFVYGVVLNLVSIHARVALLR